MIEVINFKQFKQQKFTAYRNSMGSIRTDKGPDKMIFWTESQKVPIPWTNREVTAYGKQNDCDLYGYIADDQNAYVNTGHGFARVEKKDGTPLEETLYQAYVYWQNRHEKQA